MAPKVLQPRQVGSRERARELFDALPADLSDTEVRVSFRGVRTAAPSYVDEIILLVLEQRNAKVLKLEDVSPRVATFADLSAERRGVTDRLRVDRLA